MKFTKRKYMLPIACIVFVIGLVCVGSVVDTPYRTSRKLVQHIKEGNLSSVELILQNGFDPNTPTAKPSPFTRLFEISSQVPLSVACEEGNLEMVKLLIKYGATAKYQEGTSWSPLKKTLNYYQPEDEIIVKSLLENGADSSFEESGRLPVFDASAMIPKVYDAAKTNGTVFIGEYDPVTAQGITDIVIMLLEDRNVNIVDYTGKTLLMNAAIAGNLNLVEYLISVGADIMIQDQNGKTAFDYAIENGYSDISELLNDRVAK
ncbi:MAG: hypothetical protein E7610_03425 [Ruminococcaceae bacterium]|nr:hypothetical protein [Oscillospiraceae bacterium]